MKNKLMSPYDKLMLRKRALIETTFDYLKNKFNLEYILGTAPPLNFLVHIISALISFILKPSKFKIYQPIILS